MELQHLGWNLLTVGFTGTIIFTIWGACAYLKQAQVIWTSRSAESVSVSMFSFITIAVLAMFVYGLHINSIAAMFNGSVIPLFVVPILVGLWKFKGFTLPNLVLCLSLLAALTAMIISPYKGEFFIAISLTGIIFMAAQPIEILLNRDSGDIEPRVHIMLIFRSGFWVVYALALEDKLIASLSFAYLTLFILTLVLIYRFRKPPV